MALFDILFDQTSLAVITAVVLFLSIVFSYMEKNKNLPPGPWGIPIFGYWPFLKSDKMHLQLQELRNKYGEVFSVSIAGKQHIFLSSMKMFKEVCISKAECFRRISDFSLLSFSFKDGVAMANGESWKTQRRFFHQTFKEYGLLAVKDNFSNSISVAVNETVDEIRTLEGQPIVLADMLVSKCCSIIRRVLFNDQGITEEELKELNTEYGPVVNSMTPKAMILLGNIAKYFIFPFMPSFWAMVRSHNRIVSIMEKVIQRHKSSFDKTQVLDIIDSFYKEKHDREIKGDPTAAYFTDQALLSSVYQFVTDGVLSVAFFIVLFLQNVIERPEEQEKIYEELIEVIGPERQPSFEDKNNLPYTNAFIYETLRSSNFFPLFPSLECTKETTLNGYRFPKGAIAIINLASIHYDPCIYKDPFEFNPSRFLSAPGKQKADLPIMFGTGKRACLGEPFVMSEVFLFLTTLVKNFRLSGDIGQAETILDGVNLKIYAHSRNQEFRSK